MLLALWSSLPHSLDHATFNPLLALLHLRQARVPARLPSLPQPAAWLSAPPTSLIKGWGEGSRMWRWPPAEACSLILKGRHVGLHPPSSPPLSLKLPSPGWSVRRVLYGQPGAAFPHGLFSSPLFFTPSSKDALRTAKWHQARMLYT